MTAGDASSGPEDRLPALRTEVRDEVPRRIITRNTLARSVL